MEPSGAAPSPTWWRNEDWLAVAVAIPLLVAVPAGWQLKLPALGWSRIADLAGLATTANLGSIALVTGVLVALSVCALGPLAGFRFGRLVAGCLLVFGLAWSAQLLAANARLKGLGIEYVVFALALGLLWRQVLPVPEWLAAAARTEFFIKAGIVILGAGILFPELLKAGLPGVVQAALVIPVIWQVAFRIARRLGVDDEFAVMLSSAVSICGVSAAIAACGAIQGDRRKLSYVTSLVLVCAVPMMLVMPSAARVLGLDEAVAGAWLGGTLDTTGSVLAATEMLGETASKTGAVVKLSQNVFIGFAALAISVWWTARGVGNDAGGSAPRLRIIWERFPKFVLGFLAASLVFSFLLPPEVVKAADKPLKGLREIWFSADFVSIGLETRLHDLLTLGGGRPALAFLIGQAANIAWTLGLAILLFGGGW
ncbi:MAG: YeiH family protein [Planctomycetia bacterium]